MWHAKPTSATFLPTDNTSFQYTSAITSAIAACRRELERLILNYFNSDKLIINLWSMKYYYKNWNLVFALYKLTKRTGEPRADEVWAERALILSFNTSNGTFCCILHRMFFMKWFFKLELHHIRKEASYTRRKWSHIAISLSPFS